MAITATNKLNETHAVASASSSVAFANNKLYLVSVACATDEAIISACSGGGITWVKITGASGNSVGINFFGGALFRGLVTSGASTGGLTFTLDVGTDVYISVDEFTGMDTSGTNGSGAIVQSNVSITNTGVNNSAVSLSAFGDASNAAFAYVLHQNHTNAFTPDASNGGYTELCDFFDPINNDGRMMTQWNTGSDTSITSTWTSNAGYIMGAVEIKNGVGPSQNMGGHPIPRTGVGRRAGS